ncbi:osteoclast stimulatory transmembrane protein-like [Megalops cyprinoides]|uniref:osteoclast stimulatory transmembrane protein-like n=1 Tax=Megalops cyprinoides TaxID=118141 RepID=UPI0018641D4E|nr:osteoclast stimulatory transmembrane protein-like [Megalops cyprinoides]
MAQTSGSLMSFFVGKTKATLNIIWDVYSKPTPCNLKEVFGLIVLCLAISGSTGGLLYVWMNFTLQYDPFPSLITAAVSGSTLALVLFLLHPMRCAFTIILPSLGTKQGRKILISTALTILATKCIPNMVNNVSSVVVMMKCSTQVAVEGILNSTTEIKSAVADMKEILEDIPDFTDTETIPHLQQGTNIYEMMQKLEKVSKELKADISTQQKVLETTSNVVQKVIAVAFILLLLGGSVWYLIGYLTDILLGGAIGDIVDFFGSANVKTMRKDYSYVIPMLPPRCVKELSPPEQSVLVTVGALYLTAFFMTLVEVYARRMRRKICTSFYRKREEQRVQYLLAKVLKKREGPVN